MYRHVQRVPTVFAIVIAIAAAGCSSGTGGESEDGDEQPWAEQFTMGNFSINSGSVITNQDGVSDAYLADYVLESALPSADLEFLTVHAYLPSTPSIETRIIEISVTAGRTDGSRTDNIYHSGEFVDRVTLGEQLYSVYRLSGFTVAAPPLTRTSFANVVYDFTVSYEQSGSVLDQSNKTIEIYKR